MTNYQKETLIYSLEEEKKIPKSRFERTCFSFWAGVDPNSFSSKTILYSHKCQAHTLLFTENSPATGGAV